MQTRPHRKSIGLPATRIAQTAPAVLTVMALLVPCAAVQAAIAHASAAGNREIVERPGFASSKDVFNEKEYAEASGSEFLGGVQALARTTSIGGGFAKARFSDSFSVGLAQGTDAGNAIRFQLTVPILTQRAAETHWEAMPTNPNFSPLAGARYEYSWNVADLFGTGRYVVSKVFHRPETITETAVGGLNPSFMVHLGQTINVGLFAEVSVQTTAYGDARRASAAADVSQRWGGVTSIIGFDSAGHEVALPTGFKLSLVSAETGFDYTNAAGRNPYITSPVPEPAGWALMVAGFAVIGAVVRRQATARA